MISQSSEILVDREDHSLWIRLNRPEKLNTLTAEMANEIISALRSAEADRTIRAVIITGNGANFSAGADINQFAGIDPGSAIEFHRKLNEVVLAFRTFPKPIIALLHGYALGGGLEISESADIRIATESCILGQPEVDIGINAGAGGNVVLPRIVGHGKAMYLAITGSKVPASEAFEMGLVDMVVPDESAENYVKDLVAKIANKPYETVSMIKSVMVNGSTVDVRSALEYEAAAFGYLLGTAETQERIKRFLDRRKK
ncbi:MAG: enoyl-CoA hydratase/isomerase family protein [Thermoplasmataceae archaeon]